MSFESIHEMLESGRRQQIGNALEVLFGDRIRWCSGFGGSLARDWTETEVVGGRREVN